MAHIVFYEKPGCINNTKQKDWLRAAGHDVEEVNILDHAWSKDSLKPFLNTQSVAECFNRTAPVIKSGELNPDAFSEDEAIAAMIKDPILIKRPLMLIDNTHYIQGFDKEALHALIGLDAAEGNEETVQALGQADLTTCPRLDTGDSCDDPKREENALPALTPLMELVQDMGLDVTFAYDDLVFISHNAFMFRFVGEKRLALYFNKDCPPNDARHIERTILAKASGKGLDITPQGRFTIAQIEGEENLEIQFFETDET